jgi:uncharacterized protein
MEFRILSLDGGGAWSLIQVQTLAALYGEDATGHAVLRNFDLVAANSAGSLVLAGLVEDLALADVLQYFMDADKRRSLFPPTTSVVDPALNRLLGVGPKYDARAKLPAIERLLPKTGLALLAGSMDGVKGPAGAPVHLLIVGFDYDRNRAVFFRSAPATRPGWGDGSPAEVTLAGAVHASTNAPVNYYDAPAELIDAPDRFWDGGITGCNNPAVAAVVEAAVLGQEPRDLRVLSLGTATVGLPLAAPGAPGGPLEASRPASTLTADLGKLATAILDDPPDAATFIAHALTGGDAGVPPPAVSRIVRMSPLVAPLAAADGTLAPPAGWSAAQFLHLCAIDLAALAQTDIDYIDDYCRFWLADTAPNQPIRANGAVFDPLKPEIGYAKFSEARAAWRALMPPLAAPAPAPAAAATV